MPLYRIKDQKALFLKPTSLASERILQRLVENNLTTLLNSRFVASEFVVRVDGGEEGRIDTLCLDNEKTPVIIEYKKTKGSSVISQGLFYLEWLMTHKGDFEIAAQKKLGKDVEINWENPRVIIIAERFSTYDIYGVRRMGANIELWTYRYYNNELLQLESIYTLAGEPRPGSTPTPGDEPETVVKLPDAITPTLYDLDHHLKGKSAKIQEIFDSLRENILELRSQDSGIVEVIRKMYIGYKHGKNFCEVHLYKEEIVMWLDIPFTELKDPLKMAIDASKKGHWGTGEVEARLSKMEQIQPVMELVKQAYEYVS